MSVLTDANAVRAVESVDLASPMLTLEERVIAPLPDEALTVSSASEEEELLSFLEQPKKTILLIPSRTISKFVVLLILTSLFKITTKRNYNK